jgi:hypothetical protein
VYQPTKQHFQTTMLQPVGGVIALPTAPGLGLDLDESKIDRRVGLT